MKKPFIIKADASDYAMGAVLLQLQNKRLVPIEFWSKTFQTTQVNWAIWRKELYAIILALEKWRALLLSSRTTVLSDHKNLMFLYNKKNIKQLEHRWISRLSEFRIIFVKLRDFQRGNR